MIDSGRVRQVRPGILSALDEADEGAAYDRKAVMYDAIVGHARYTAVMWSVPRERFTSFAARALDAAGANAVAEVGCGSLLFTAGLYGERGPRNAVLVDRSVVMLERARDRLGPSCGRGRRVTLLHADAAHLPLDTGRFGSVLTLNLLHVPCDRAAIIAECGRLLVPGVGKLFASCLVRSGRGHDLPLRFFHRMGQLGPPLTRDELLATLIGDWGSIASTRYEGSMAFVVVRRKA